MRASNWRLASLCACIATAALMILAGAASAAGSGANFTAPFSVTGSGAPKGDPFPFHKPSGQPLYKPASSAWTQVTNVPIGFSPGSMLQGLDGSVYFAEDDTGIWYKLSPNLKTGSYANGKWTQIASMPSGYAPLYFASQVLSDGRMLIVGGEYNGGSQEVWTNKGAIYNPLNNTWKTVNPPTGWQQIGDAQSTLLRNGQFIMGKPFGDSSGTGTDFADALFNSSNLTWTVQPGTGKADRNDEEGYQLLPNGQILTVNDIQAIDNPSSPGSQVYSTVSDKWTNAGTLPSVLADASSQELGPMIYRPGGQVFAEGASGTTAVYHGGTNWSAGPNEPSLSGTQYDAADAPAAPLPNGGVLMSLSPGVFNPPTHFFVYNGSTITQAPDTANASSDPSFVGRMMVLPTGQIAYDDGSGDLELYNNGGNPNSGWRPTVSSLSSTVLTPGSAYTLSGTQLAGRSTGAGYGDDNQSQTNYPLVRITNTATGAVKYARTSLMTTHSIQAGVSSSTKFTVANGTASGPSTLVVIANGIASAPQAVTIQ